MWPMLAPRCLPTNLPSLSSWRVKQRLTTRCLSSSTASGAPGVLWLSPVWPERSSSAAGVRTCDLLAGFQKRGWRTSVASPAKPNEHTEALRAAGVAAHTCPPNRAEALQGLLAAEAPRVVVFDRFYAEEAFSFRVRELAPGALRVLDMQDVHFLRAGRQALAESGAPAHQVLACRPDAHSPDCLRELAAIHRSDLTLVCSPVELQMLVQQYGVPAHKLALAPFFAPPSPHVSTEAAASSFDGRQHVMMIGNFRHPPNWDSVQWACTEVWPLIKQQLPPHLASTELHIYGAYPSGAAQRLHRPEQGVRVKGFAPSLDMMVQYRASLAPLRYGAGLKGKVVDSWWHGLPVVTTPVGAEGMHGDMEQALVPGDGTTTAAEEGFVWQESSTPQKQQQQHWGGLCSATTAGQLAADTVSLLSDAQLWRQCQQQGFSLLEQLYGREANLGHVQQALSQALEQQEQRRQQDYVGGMLWQQQLRATEYFSRWIELKESMRQIQQQQQQQPAQQP